MRGSCVAQRAGRHKHQKKVAIYSLSRAGVEHHKSAKFLYGRGSPPRPYRRRQVRFLRVVFAYCPLPPSRVPCLRCCDPRQLAYVPLPAPKAVVFVLVCIELVALPKRGVREVHSTARAAAVRPNGRAAWDDADDKVSSISSVFLLQRMSSGFGFVGKRHNHCLLYTSPSPRDRG